MNYEIYEDQHHYYLAAVRDDGGCVAVEMFDRDTLCSPDGDMSQVLRKCFEAPLEWKEIIAHGMAVPVLVYPRKLLSDECDLIAWTLPNGKWCRRYDSIDEQLSPDMIDPDEPDYTDFCEQCRASGLLDEE